MKLVVELFFTDDEMIDYLENKGYKIKEYNHESFVDSIGDDIICASVGGTVRYALLKDEELNINLHKEYKIVFKELILQKIKKEYLK